MTTYQKESKAYVHDHLLFCNHLESFDNFSILTRENKRSILQALLNSFVRLFIHFFK